MSSRVGFYFTFIHFVETIVVYIEEIEIEDKWKMS